MIRVLALLSLSFLFSAVLAAQSLVMISGNGQVVQEQFRTNVPMVVQAKDAAGHPAAGVAVTWAITQGSGTLSNLTNTTDSNGQAEANFLGTTLQPGSSFVASTIVASTATSSVSFVATTSQLRGPTGGFVPAPLVELLKPDIGATLTGASGTTLPRAVSIRVTAQSGVQAGSPIPNVALRIQNNEDPTAPPPALCNGPAGVVLTDSTGTATCDLILSGPAGTTRIAADVGEFQITPAFFVQVTGGAACSFSISPASQLFGPNGGAGTVNVTAGATCGWTATSNASFVTVTSGASGIGNGTVAYSVAAGSATRSGTISIAGQTFTVNQNGGTPGGLAISTTSLPPATVSSSYSATLTATGGQSPYTWSVSGTLPTGLSLNSSSGVISGTPSVAGSFGFTITVRDNTGATQPQNFTITVNGPSSTGFKITTVSLPNGVVGQSYSQLLASSGGCVTPFSPSPSFQVTAGALPGGLNLQTNSDGTRSIVGTPTASGNFTFTLTARDACGNTANAGFTIVVAGTAGSQQMTFSPTSLAFTVQLGAANIPADQAVNLNSSSGALTYTATVATNNGGNWLIAKSGATGGTPGAVTVGVANFSNLAAGTYAGTITIASQASNSPAVVQVSLTVLAPPALTTSPNTLSMSQAPSSGPNISRQNIALASGTTSVHFTAVASTTKGGQWLSVSPSEGNTPASLTAIVNSGGLAAGTYAGTILITPASGAPQTVTITLTILAPAVLAASPAPLSFTYQQGAIPPATQTLAVTSTGTSVGVSVSASTFSGGSWLFVDPATASTAANLTVSVNPAGLAPGIYAGRINVTPADAGVAALSVPVTLTVSQAPPALSAITNGASFAPGPIAPGEIVTLFGTALGPATLAGLEFTDSGRIATTVADTQVLFDGFPAPILYTSAGQVSAIVPYEVAGNPTTNVQIQYLGVRSNALTVRVIDSAPGIFVTDPSGQGAILNEDYGINSTQNGAEPGSVISIFGTGEGQTDPGGVDGTITGSVLRKPRLSVTVQIGGQNAEVLYAGAAPFQPAGVLQVNARIPSGVPRGKPASVLIVVGTASSQAGVNVAIKP